MTTLMQASRQWVTRPADERFVSLYEMQDRMRELRERSQQAVVSTRKFAVLPDPADNTHRGLLIEARDPALDGSVVAPTHWSFGQLCSLAAMPSPASYFRDSRLPAEIIADALNYNLRFTRDVDEVKLLSTPDELRELRAINGPNYGRIWNADVVDMLVVEFGDGVSGHWRVPGEFGQRVEIKRDNTTLLVKRHANGTPDRHRIGTPLGAGLGLMGVDGPARHRCAKVGCLNKPTKGGHP